MRKGEEEIRTPERLKEVMETYLTGVSEYVLDVETTGLDVYNDILVGICLYNPDLPSFYVPFNHTDLQNKRVEGQMTEEECKAVMLPYLANGSLKCINHNIKFDDTLIDKSEYDFDIWLQRGCGSEAIDSMLGITGFSSMTNEQLQKFVGKGGRQYNFISAGVAKGKGFSGEVICNIYAPKGTKMIYAEPFSYYSGADYDTSGFDDWDGTKKQSTFGGESEMIIQRGAYYRITKIEKSGYTTYIDMEVVLDKGYDKFQQRGAFKGLER